MISSKRDQILQSALFLISENGFHGASVAAVAKEANVGMGTIYRYFENKEALINEIYRAIKTELIKAMMLGIEGGSDTDSRFSNVWRNLAHYYMTHPDALNFMEQFSNSPYFMKVTEQERWELQYPIYQFVQQAQEQGEMKDAPIEILMTMVYGTIVALVRMHINGDYVLDEQAIETAVSVSWDAVKD